MLLDDISSSFPATQSSNLPFEKGRPSSSILSISAIRIGFISIILRHDGVPSIIAELLKRRFNALSIARLVCEVSMMRCCWSFLICCQINSDITVVFPVPGGPCKRHKSVANRPFTTASCCEELSDSI